MLDLYLNFFEDEEAAVRRVEARPAVGLGLLAYGLGAAGFLFALGVTSRLPSASWLPWALALWWASAVFSGVLAASVSSFFAAAAGAKASPPVVFILLGLCDLVWTLAAPLFLIARAAGGGTAALLAVWAVLGGLVFMWRVRAFKAHCRVGPVTAAWLAVAPSLIGPAVAVFGTVVAVWSMGSLFGG